MADSRKRHFAKTGNDRIDENFRRIASQFNWLDITNELPTAGQDFYGHEFILHTPSGGIPYICLKDAGLSNYTWTPYKGGVYAGPFGPLIWPTDPFLEVRDKLEDSGVANITQGHFDTTYAECQKRNLSAICPVASLDLVGVKWKHATATGDKFVICTYDSNYTPYWLGPITPVNINTFPPDVPDDQPTDDPDYGNPMLVIDPFEPDTCPIWDKEAEGNVKGLTDKDHYLQGESSMRISKCIEIDDFDGDDNGDPEWTVLDSNGVAEGEAGYTEASCTLTQDTDTKFSGAGSLKISRGGPANIAYAHTAEVSGDPTSSQAIIGVIDTANQVKLWEISETYNPVSGADGFWSPSAREGLTVGSVLYSNDYVYVVYTGWTFNESSITANQEIIIRKYNATNGNVEWTFRDYVTDSVITGHTCAGAIDDTGLYATIVSGYLYKINPSTGSQIFKVDYNSVTDGKFTGCAVGDYIYSVGIVSGIPGQVRLIAHSKTDGSISWSSAVQQAAGDVYCGAMAYSDGKLFLVTQTQRRITAGNTTYYVQRRNPSTGALIWANSYSTYKYTTTATSLAVSGDYVYFSPGVQAWYEFDFNGNQLNNGSIGSNIITVCGTSTNYYINDFGLAPAASQYDNLSVTANWTVTGLLTDYISGRLGGMSGGDTSGGAVSSDDMVITRTFDSSTDNTDLSDEIQERIKIKSTFEDIDLTLETTDTVGGIQTKTWNIPANSSFEEFTWDISGIKNANKANLASAKITIVFNTAPTGGQATWLDIWEACPGDTPDDEPHRIHRRWSTAFNLSQYATLKLYIRGPANDINGDPLILGRVGVQWSNGTTYYDLQNVDGTEWYLVTIPITDDNRLHGDSVFQFEFVPPPGEDEFPESFNVEFMYALPQP